jgi:UDP-galactopyranose mutase
LYAEDAKKLSNYIVGGRLGSYRYYDMHQVIAEALTAAQKEGYYEK